MYRQRDIVQRFSRRICFVSHLFKNNPGPWLEPSTSSSIMWQPGTPSPAAGKNSSQKKNKKQKNKTHEESLTPPLQGSESIRGSTNAKGTTPTAMSSTPKRLSGATMNMRFMKRKQETQEQENERKRVTLERAQASMGFETTTTETATTSPRSALSATVLTAAAPSPQIPAPLVAENEFKECDDDDNDNNMDTDEPTTQGYQVATPIDMYGLQAALLGRRSFGGFNTAIEDAWKTSKESLEMDASIDRPNRKKQQQATEEELIQQYQDIVKKRSESSRAVGNLKDKGRRQRR